MISQVGRGSSRLDDGARMYDMDETDQMTVEDNELTEDTDVESTDTDGQSEPIEAVAEGEDTGIPRSYSTSRIRRPTKRLWNRQLTPSPTASASSCRPTPFMGSALMLLTPWPFNVFSTPRNAVATCRRQSSSVIRSPCLLCASTFRSQRRLSRRSTGQVV